MFQRILLAWSQPKPPDGAVRIARELAREYEAQLVVCCIGDGLAEARAAVGAEADVESLPARHGARELLHYAYEHAFDLVVVGRRASHDRLPEELVAAAAMPVLVVGEAAATGEGQEDHLGRSRFDRRAV
jgi:hypothetical protein